MSSAVRAYLDRAVRYTVRPQDDSVMRFAFNKRNPGQSFQTEFINISATGLAFTAEPSFIPRIGEIIKVEFPIPGHDRMAWYARVVRIEEREHEEIWFEEGPDATHTLPPGFVIAVKFMDMPDGHRKTIEDALNLRFAEIYRDRQIRRLRNSMEWARHHYFQVAVYTLATIVALYALSFLSNMFSSQEIKPVIWGERFAPPGPTDQ